MDYNPGGRKRAKKAERKQYCELILGRKQELELKTLSIKITEDIDSSFQSEVWTFELVTHFRTFTYNIYGITMEISGIPLSQSVTVASTKLWHYWALGHPNLSSLKGLQFYYTVGLGVGTSERTLLGTALATWCSNCTCMRYLVACGPMELELTGSWEPPIMGAGMWTHVLCKSRKSLQDLVHLQKTC